MALLADRVKETTTTTGTGTITLAGASSGFQAFTAAFTNGQVVYYAIVDNTAFTWEVGYGTFTTSGTTLSRTAGQVLAGSSGAGVLVSFGAGSKDVFCTAPAGSIVTPEGVQTLTWKTLTNPVINGFTGDTSLINIGSGQVYKTTAGETTLGYAGVLNVAGYNIQFATAMAASPSGNWGQGNITYGNNNSISGLVLGKTRGATPTTYTTAVAADDIIGILSFAGSDGTNFDSKLGIVGRTPATWSSSSSPINLDFYVTGVGLNTDYLTMRLAYNANEFINDTLINQTGVTPTSALDILGHGPSAQTYNCITMRNSNNNTVEKGGAIVGARKTNANAVSTVFCAWDDGTNREVFFGGGGWNNPDATKLSFWAAATYNETIDQGIQKFAITGASVFVGTASLATSATTGFFWIPSCAGAPTGAATAPYTEAAGLVVDSTNFIPYFRVLGTWYATATVTGTQDLTNKRISYAAGSTTVAPIQLASGTNLTTPVAGAIEYDGTASYLTTETTIGRALVTTRTLYQLTANQSAIGAAIADFFPTTSTITLAAAAVYKIEAQCYFTKTTAGTVTVTLTSAQAPVNIAARLELVNASGTVWNSFVIVGSTSTAAAFTASTSIADTVSGFFTVNAVVATHATNSGTFKIRVTESAGTVTPLRGSYYTVQRLPSGSTGTYV